MAIKPVGVWFTRTAGRQELGLFKLLNVLKPRITDVATTMNQPLVVAKAGKGN